MSPSILRDVFESIATVLESFMEEKERRTPRKGSRILVTTIHMRGQKPRRTLYQDGVPADGDRERAFRRVILSIPPGKVSTYGKVAAAAGYPLYHRAVARLLRTDPPDQLPWHRVLGAGGEMKLPGPAAKEQMARLRLEGVQFRGDRVNMDLHEHAFRVWEILD